MRVKIDKTFNLTEDQVKCLVELAKTTGHSYDSERKKLSNHELIRRYLTSELESKVYYCHEHLSKD